jgi:hypothetical protein
VAERPILVISPDWQTRALVAAQVGEETGRDVMSAPSVGAALVLVRIAGINPAVVIVDAAQKIPPQDVEQIETTLPGAPLVLCVSALRRATFDPLHTRCAAYLVRPVSIGKIVQATRHVLGCPTKPGRSAP